LADAFAYTVVGDYAFTLTTDAGTVERGHGPPSCVGLSEGDKSRVAGGRTFSPQPASYVVAPLSMLESSGEIISLQVRLRHE
jgi:hypothetical protein